MSFTNPNSKETKEKFAQASEAAKWYGVTPRHFRRLSEQGKAPKGRRINFPGHNTGYIWLYDRQDVWNAAKVYVIKRHAGKIIDDIKSRRPVDSVASEDKFRKIMLRFVIRCGLVELDSACNYKKGDDALDQKLDRIMQKEFNGIWFLIESSEY